MKIRLDFTSTSMEQTIHSRTAKTKLRRIAYSVKTLIWIYPYLGCYFAVKLQLVLQNYPIK